MTFKAGEEYALRLSKLAGKQGDEIARKAVHSGAGILADQIRKNLVALPEDKFRHLSPGESFAGLPPEQKKDLVNALGITPIQQDDDGDWNAKVGFDGYGTLPTKAYPKGVPNQLIARATESGSSIRDKHPFVRPAVKAAKGPAQKEMNKTINDEIEKIMKK